MLAPTFLLNPKASPPTRGEAPLEVNFRPTSLLARPRLLGRQADNNNRSLDPHPPHRHQHLAGAVSLHNRLKRLRLPLRGGQGGADLPRLQTGRLSNNNSNNARHPPLQPLQQAPLLVLIGARSPQRMTSHPRLPTMSGDQAAREVVAISREHTGERTEEEHPHTEEDPLPLPLPV